MYHVPSVVQLCQLPSLLQENIVISVTPGIKILQLIFFLHSGFLQAGEDQDLFKRWLVLDAVRSGDHIVAAGERGHILLSEDDQTWQIINTQTTATLTSVFFHDGMLGWAAGHDAVILKTTDGGRHWRQVYQDPDRYAPVLDIWFADKDYGIAVGAYGLYLMTTDGGETWIKNDLHIVNRDVREAEQDAAGPAPVSRLEANVEPYDLHLNSIACSGSGTLYIAAESGHLYRSDDRGRTWQELPSPYTGSFFGVLPLEQESVLVFGLRGHLYRSRDGGDSWDNIDTHTNEMLTSGIRLHDGSIVLTGMGGVVLTSQDQGRTFAVRALRYMHGYAAVAESGRGELIITGDHGIETWRRKDIGLAHD